ncbi:sensor domain-containing diguanylate cyclase [Methylobacterium sp. Leaf89]|uniref:sensor domain-containing diguanylate cyclase n=1 Tax=Methylobacterium sp. Leaf89 TaxID=1736245 RepID=UPI000A4B8D98|nr:sensor domain-containing diguanylate cyclase [Methylobacterium sp. Leaf89]
MSSDDDPIDPLPTPHRPRLASAALRLATRAVDAAAAQRWRDTATILTLRGELAAQAALIQRQADALADMTRIFEAASAEARIGLWQCDLPDESLRWSEGVYDLFEFPHGSPVSRPETLACYTEEARRHLVAVRAEAIGRRSPFTLDAEIVAGRGSRRWIRITGSVETRAGVPVRLFGFKQDITEQKLSADRTRYRAEFDRMTGLANRSVFDERLAQLSESGALFLVDLDGFKAINDTYGHAVGDVCLQEAARRLRAACQETDLVARIGGDEFAVLVEREADGPFCEAIGRRIVAAMRDPYHHRGVCLRFGASVGIARVAASAPADLFTRADAALYAAKAAGRGTLRMALPR